MDKMRVSRQAIIDRITENRSKHRDVYERAMEAYRKAAISQLNEWIDKLRAGKFPSLYSRLPVPEDHTREYDAILDLLAMGVDGDIEIDLVDFRRYVRDEWDWKGKFISDTSTYAVS